jgi:hypothetical protein
MDFEFLSYITNLLNLFLFLSIFEKINVVLIIINIILGSSFLQKTIAGKVTLRTPKLRLLIIILSLTFIIVEVLSIQSIHLWATNIINEEYLLESGDVFIYDGITKATENYFQGSISYLYTNFSKILRSLSYLIFFASLHFFKGTYRKWQI